MGFIDECGMPDCNDPMCPYSHGKPTPAGLPEERWGQADVLRWAVANFGPIAANRDERAARLVEEAIEVAQAEGLGVGIIATILSRVYSRPPGELGREIGGVALTLYARAENCGRNVDVEADREYRRVTSLPKEWWARKHAEKVAAGTADLSPASIASGPSPPIPDKQESKAKVKET